jgi:CelD/BcsL family acetyltransferase involved in cellulose biosynthesis
MSSGVLDMTTEMSRAVSTRIFTGKSGFAELQPEWDKLASACGYHFLHYPVWYHAELENLENADSVFFVALYDANQLFAVLPLERVFLRKGGLRMPVMQLFYPNEMGVNDVVADRPLAPYRQLLQTALRRELPFFAFIRWQCVLDNGCAVSLLPPDKKPRNTHASKYIDFSQGFTTFWDSYSSKFRKGLLKKLRKAEEQGELRLVCATSAETLPQAFEDFLAVEDSGWKGERGTSIKKQPRKLAFYRHLLKEYGERDICQINILYLNDVPIAAQFGVRVGRRLFLLKIGFREDYAAVSPGYLVLYKLVEQSSARGEIDSVSFVTGVNWIDRWHPRHLDVGIFYLSNGSWLSELLVTGLVKAIEIRERRKQPEKAEDATDGDD